MCIFAIRCDLSIGIDDHRAVMIETRRAFFKYRHNDGNIIFLRRFLNVPLMVRHGFRQIKGLKNLLLEQYCER